MTATPVVTSKELIRVLKKLEFVRSVGSHQRFAHADGRKTTVPVHQGRDIPKGLLRKIVVYDMGISMEEFVQNL